MRRSPLPAPLPATNANWTNENSVLLNPLPAHACETMQTLNLPLCRWPPCFECPAYSFTVLLLSLPPLPSPSFLSSSPVCDQSGSRQRLPPRAHSLFLLATACLINKALWRRQASGWRPAEGEGGSWEVEVHVRDDI